MKELETPKGMPIQRQFIRAWAEAGDDKNVFFKHNTTTVIIVQDHEAD